MTVKKYQPAYLQIIMLDKDIIATSDDTQQKQDFEDEYGVSSVGFGERTNFFD